MPEIKNISARMVNGILPGKTFTVDAKTYDRHRKASSWGKLFADTDARMPDARPLPDDLDLSKLSEPEAIKRVRAVEDLDTLSRWSRTEERVKVLDAIEKRGEKLTS
jgi:hypothetical protein